VNTLSGRLFARVSVYVQSALIGVCFWRDVQRMIGDWRPAWAPPVWFAGLHERLLGDPDTYFHSLANRALLAVLAAAVLMVARISRVTAATASC